jgi:hypothetical protein
MSGIVHGFVIRGLANGLTCRADFGCRNPGLGCEVVVPEAICRCSEDPFQVRLCEVLADWLACLLVVATRVLRVRGQSVLEDPTKSTSPIVLDGWTPSLRPCHLGTPCGTLRHVAPSAGIGGRNSGHRRHDYPVIGLPCNTCVLYRNTPAL